MKSGGWRKLDEPHIFKTMYLPAKDRFLHELGKHFDGSYNLKKRVYITADIEMFRWREDVSVWKQKREKTPMYYSVYFDHEFICGFSEADTLEKVMLEWWKGFKKAYQDKLIDLDEVKSRELCELRELKQKQLKQEAEMKIDKLPAQTETQKLAKEVIKRVAHKKPTPKRKKS